MPQNDNPSGNPYVKAFHDLMSTSKDFMGFLGDPGERQGIRQGFTDAVNRGAVAATLGAPVDMANRINAPRRTRRKRPTAASLAKPKPAPHKPA